MSCYGLQLFGKDIVNILIGWAHKLCARLHKIAQPTTVNLDQDMHSVWSRQQRPAASAPNTWLSFSSILHWAQIALFAHGGRTTQCVQCN